MTTTHKPRTISQTYKPGTWLMVIHDPASVSRLCVGDIVEVIHHDHIADLIHCTVRGSRSRPFGDEAFLSWDDVKLLEVDKSSEEVKVEEKEIKPKAVAIPMTEINEAFKRLGSDASSLGSILRAYAAAVGASEVEIPEEVTTPAPPPPPPLLPNMGHW